MTQIPAYMTGGAKFRVTFKSDGTQIVDYQGMERFRGGNSTMTFAGRASGKITTDNGAARIANVSSPCATVKTPQTIRRSSIIAYRAWGRAGSGPQATTASMFARRTRLSTRHQRLLMGTRLSR